MKTLFKHLMLLTLVLASGVACSKKTMKAVDNTPTAPAPVENPVNPYGGATVPLQVVSLARLEDYAGRYINTPTDIKISIDVFDVSETDDRFGGTLKVSYTEVYNGAPVSRVGTFNSGTSEHETKYNKWANTGGRQKFKAIFQDTLGAMIIILEDEGNDLGTFRGKVYYRNFDFGVCSNPPPWMVPQCNQQSPQKCWNISAGPYDCRAFMSGSNMSPSTVDLPGFGSRPSGYDGPGYQELGSFTNLDIRAALNLQ